MKYSQMCSAYSNISTFEWKVIESFFKMSKIQDFSNILVKLTEFRWNIVVLDYLWGKNWLNIEYCANVYLNCRNFSLLFNIQLYFTFNRWRIRQNSTIFLCILKKLFTTKNSSNLSKVNELQSCDFKLIMSMNSLYILIWMKSIIHEVFVFRNRIIGFISHKIEIFIEIFLWNMFVKKCKYQVILKWIFRHSMLLLSKHVRLSKTAFCIHNWWKVCKIPIIWMHRPRLKMSRASLNTVRPFHTIQIPFAPLAFNWIDNVFKYCAEQYLKIIQQFN